MLCLHSCMPLKIRPMLQCDTLLHVGLASVDIVGIHIIKKKQWDNQPFLNMKPDPEVGRLALALRALLIEDLDPKNNRYASCHDHNSSSSRVFQHALAQSSKRQ